MKLNFNLFCLVARLLFSLTFLISSATCLLAQNKPASTDRPVSFAMEQAARGEKRFMQECVDCHGKDLKGGMNGGAPLRGLAFEKKYFGGLPASVLYAFMSGAMPPNAPGRYSPTGYADLMAFILKRNGIRAGNPLPADFPSLNALTMNK